MTEDKQLKAYAEAAENLKALIAEARGTRKDLAGDLKNIKEKAQKEVKDYIDGQVKIRLELLGKETEDAMARAVARVDAQFAKLADLYLKGTDETKPDLEELLTEAARKINKSRSGQVKKIKKITEI